MNAPEFAVCVNRMRDENEGAEEEEGFTTNSCSEKFPRH